MLRGVMSVAVRSGTAIGVAGVELLTDPIALAASR